MGVVAWHFAEVTYTWCTTPFEVDANVITGWYTPILCIIYGTQAFQNEYHMSVCINLVVSWSSRILTHLLE